MILKNPLVEIYSFALIKLPGRFCLHKIYRVNIMKSLKPKFTNGFTIIELLVVIVIISVLTVIVTSNILKYIAKGKDAVIRHDLATLQTYGAQYYESQESYAGFCSDPKVLSIASSIPKENFIGWNGGTVNMECYTNVSNTEWCACSYFTNWPGTSMVFCVDSQGTKIEGVNNCSNACSTGYCNFY